MKKTKSKFFISLLLACVMFFTISLSGCGLGKLLKVVSYDECIECGDFIYRPQKTDDGEHTVAILYGLSNAGKEKVGVIVPDEVDGLQVAYLTGIYWETGTDRKIKLFITSPCAIPFSGGFSSRTSISFNVHDSLVKAWGFSSTICTYGPRGDTFGDKYSDEEYYKVFKNHCYKKYANVTYGYNYEAAPYLGIYWIDDYNGTTIDFIPPDPFREGYTFEGWYKDEEGTEKWDFEKDIVPEKVVLRPADSAHDVVYEDSNTILYAKWRKNA